jgi:adenosyl cobinamide kinase/adenosyl cobinamide phosphate guanylyltransferase
MLAFDDEDRARVERHIKERAGLGFETIEQPRNISACLVREGPDGTFLIDSVTALVLNEMFPDIDDSWDLGQVVVFNTDIGQCEQNFLQWDRCIGDIYCDEDDYNTFMEEHEEFQTKEWHIAHVKKYMSEHDISLEDLK